VRLLLVEDSERFAALLKTGLRPSGFAVDIIATAEDAAAALKTTRWDVIVLDLGIPDADGLDLLADLRRRADTTPVLILSARGSLRDRITGLEAGADDYLVKPFALEELVARLQALLRRPGHLLGLALTVGNLTLDTVARQVFVDDKPIALSARDWPCSNISYGAVERSSANRCSKVLFTDRHKRSAPTRSRSMSTACGDT
jgi:DNA-binding response OmpR family regulator